MKLIVIAPFKWAHRNVEVKEYLDGDEIDTEDADLIDVAIREKWVEAVVVEGDGADLADDKASKSPQNKARKQAPENKGA